MGGDRAAQCPGERRDLRLGLSRTPKSWDYTQGPHGAARTMPATSDVGGRLTLVIVIREYKTIAKVMLLHRTKFVWRERRWHVHTQVETGTLGCRTGCLGRTTRCLLWPFNRRTCRNPELTAMGPQCGGRTPFRSRRRPAELRLDACPCAAFSCIRCAREWVRPGPAQQPMPDTNAHRAGRSAWFPSCRSVSPFSCPP